MQIRKECTLGSLNHPEARVKVFCAVTEKAAVTQSAMFQHSSRRCLIVDSGPARFDLQDADQLQTMDYCH